MTIQLSDKYPKIIRDLFLYDTVDTPVPANTPNYESLVCSHFGFMEIMLPFKVQHEDLLEEALKLNWKDKDGTYIWVFGQNKPLEEKLTTGMGFDYDTEYKSEFKLEPESIPHFTQFYNALNEICPITDLTLKRIKPGGYLTPHVDPFANPFKIYLALSWPKGSYFKMYKKGFIPLKPGRCFWVNVGDHSHAVVNDSKEDRIIISLYADWHTPAWRDLVEHSYKEYHTIPQ